MKFAMQLPDPVEREEALLASELGWPEVARGLMRIVWGNLLPIAGAAVGLFLTVATIFDAGLHKNLSMAAIDKSRPIHVLMLTVAPFIIGAGVFWGYWMSLRGQWMCLMSTPERHGAKWQMYVSILTVLMNFGLGIVTGFMGVPTPKNNSLARFDGTPETLHELLDWRHPAVSINLFSLLLNIIGGVTLLLYLKAAARCFNDRFRMALVDYYMMFMACFTATAVGAVWFLPKTPKMMGLVACGVGLGILASFLGWLALILIIRSGIIKGLRKVQSPFDHYEEPKQARAEPEPEAAGLVLPAAANPERDEVEEDGVQVSSMEMIARKYSSAAPRDERFRPGRP